VAVAGCPVYVMGGEGRFPSKLSRPLELLQKAMWYYGRVKGMSSECLVVDQLRVMRQSESEFLAVMLVMSMEVAEASLEDELGKSESLGMRDDARVKPLPLLPRLSTATVWRPANFLHSAPLLRQTADHRR